MLNLFIPQCKCVQVTVQADHLHAKQGLRGQYFDNPMPVLIIGIETWTPQVCDI